MLTKQNCYRKLTKIHLLMLSYLNKGSLNTSEHPCTIFNNFAHHQLRGNWSKFPKRLVQTGISCVDMHSVDMLQIST